MVRSVWCSTKKLPDQETAAGGCKPPGNSVNLGNLGLTFLPRRASLSTNIKLGVARAQGVPGLGSRTSRQIHKGGELPT